MRSSQAPRPVFSRSRRPSPATAVVALAYAVGCGRTAETAVDAGPHDAVTAAAAKDAHAEAPDIHIDRAAVDAMVNPSHLPPYDGPTGSVEGTVFVKGPEAPDVRGLVFTTCPAGLDTYGKLFREGPPRDDGLRPLADAAVVVTGYSVYLPEKHEAEGITISPNCGYAKRTIAMTFGQRLDIANDSKFPFAPLLSGQYQAAVMIAPPGQNGDPVKFYPPRPGHFMIGDQMQPFVSETLLVLLQPLHAVSDLSGHYRIDGIPVGKLKLGAQLDALGPRGVQVDLDVRPNVVEKLDLELTYVPWDAGAPAPMQRIIP